MFLRRIILGALAALLATSTAHARLDPYKNLKYRLKWDGQVVAAFDAAGPHQTEVIKHRDGGDPSTPRKLPGRDKYEAITLERGLTQDGGFRDWAGLVWNYGEALGSEVSLANYRKDIVLEIYNEAGEPAAGFKLRRCWASEYKVAPGLDTGVIAIEHIKLDCEGFERDMSIGEPEPVVK